MKHLYLFIFIAAASIASCGKKDYTCTCVDKSNTYSTKVKKIEASKQSKAVSECVDEQTKLNVTGSNYSCTINP